jgi:predicted dehydrogenase
VSSFEELIQREDLDAIYIPQPPALHFKWAQMALNAGKHVMVEKPSTTCLKDSTALVELAKKNNLALHENYMFQYHSQIKKIRELVDSGVIGKLRLIRADFGFPMRAKNDFRYNQALGGGALLDAGGYTMKLASILLGPSVKVDASCMVGMEGYEVDMAGSATLSNDDGLVCQIGYGMDCGYKCSIELWGSTGRILSNRIFTAPPEYVPTATIETNSGKEEVTLEADSHFEHSIETFVRAVREEDFRQKLYDGILTQAGLVEAVRNKNINRTV